MSTFKRTLAAVLIAVFAASGAAPVLADPPPWAPAHGWRAKHGHKHKFKRRHDDLAYVAPYGIDLGRCNRDVLGALVGGAAGAAIGSNIGKGDGRTAAIIGGTILGAIVGGSIGRSMDDVDRACVGQVLEHAEDGQQIVWQDPNRDATYRVTPVETRKRSDGRYCREYQTTAVIGGRTQRTYGTACRQPDGSWELVS